MPETSLSSAQLSQAARLDGSLAFGLVFDETQQLIISDTAKSSLSGLIKAMEDVGGVGKALAALSRLGEKLSDAVELEKSNKILTGDTATAQFTEEKVQESLISQAGAVKAETNEVSNAATSATSAASAALDDATAARNAAQAVVNALPSGAPQAEKDLAALRLAQAQELLGLATATKAAAVQVKSAAEENVLAAVALEAGNSVEGRAKATAAAALAENAVGSSEAVVVATTAALSVAQGRYDDAEVALNADPTNQSLQANRDARESHRDGLASLLELAEQVKVVADRGVTASQEEDKDVGNHPVISTLALANSPIGRIDSLAEVAADDPVQKLETLRFGDPGAVGSGQYSMAFWGDENTGYWTLMDEEGAGVIVDVEGRVDQMDGSTAGWQFPSTSSFLLPDGTKITVVPEYVDVTRADGTKLEEFVTTSVLVFRGSKLAEYSWNPEESSSGSTVEAYWDSQEINRGGKNLDELQNDGHIFTPDSTTIGLDTMYDVARWETGGQRIAQNTGENSERERVAVDPSTGSREEVNREVAVSSGVVDVEGELMSFLLLNDFDSRTIDADGDGQLDTKDLVTITNFIINLLSQYGNTFQAILDGTQAGVDNLRELTLYLERLMDRVNEEQGDRDQLNAEELADLNFLRQRLQEASLEPAPRANPEPLSVSSTATGEATGGAVEAPLPESLESIVAQARDGGATPGELAERLLAALADLGIGSSQENPGALAEQLEAQLRALAEGAEGAVLGELTALLERISGGADFVNILVQKLVGVVSPADVSAVSQGGSNALRPGNLAAAAAGNDSLPSAGAALRRASRVLSGFQGLGSTSALLKDVVPAKEQNEPARAPAPQVSSAPIAMGASGIAPAGVQGSSAPIFLAQGGSGEALKEAISNLRTDPEQLARAERQINEARKSQASLLGRAENLHNQAKETVTRFFTVLSENSLLKEIVYDDDLSEAENAMFMEKMNALYRNWGIEWGSSEEGSLQSPEVAAQLVSRAIRSGML